MPLIWLGDFIYRSDLREILSSCPEDEIPKIIDWLLRLPKNRALKIMREKYNYDEHRPETKKH